MGASAGFRWAFISAGLIFLTACGGGSVSPGGSPALRQAMHGASSDLRHPSDQDLLYVPDDNLIDVFSYPQGDLVQSFYGYGSGYADAACVDSGGNVYITFSYGSIVEYPHGGSDPIGSSYTGGAAEGCTVDPMTGNVAVANPSGSSPTFGHGFVWVWNKPTGGYHYYSSRNFKEPIWCGYDNSGNLFIEGYSWHAGKRNLRLFELPRGGASLKNVAISVTGGATGVQYDGKYLTIGAGNNIYQLRIKGSKAKVVGTTTLTGWSARSYFVVVKGRRQGRQAVSTTGSEIGLFNYPAGGDATKTITVNDAFSAVVSLARNSEHRN